MGKTKRSEIFTPKQSLRKGEYYLEDRGLYYCYYYDETGKRRRLTSKALESLREARLEVENLLANKVKTSAKDRTLDSVYHEWLSLKRGLAAHTKQNYTWVYEHYCLNSKLGKMRIQDITKGTIRDHYNKLRNQHHLSVTTIDGLQTVINQVCGFAVEERYIPANPAIGCMTEMKRESNKPQSHPALTKAEQDRLLSYVETHEVYKHWYPILKIFIGTGLRVGELTGLRWKDVDLEAGTISVNHSLSYFSQEGKMQFIVGKPKTKAGYRTVVMINGIKEAFLQQKKYLEEAGITCNISIEGTKDAGEPFYTDFIFLNRNGGAQHQGTLNKAFNRIIRDANVEATDNESLTILPPFSCHCLRSTYITRSAEKGIPIEVTMKQVGHDDKKTTMKVYTTVHPDWQRRELQAMEDLFG